MKEKNQFLNETVKTILELILVAIVTLFVCNKVINPVIVSGKSMYPYLDNNDLSIIKVYDLKEKNLQRFDVVVLDCDKLNEKIVKRLIGFPGETIKYENDQLYIDGVAYDEPYLDQDYIKEEKIKQHTDLFTEDFEYTIPEGEYFVLGDNRLVSADSRILGTFTFDDFVGHGGYVLFPFNHAKKLGTK